MDPSQQTYGCPLCGAEMHRAPHCRLRCDNCGYTEDCSDLFEGSAAVYNLPTQPGTEPQGDGDAPSVPADWSPRVN
jgi:hypothetical protein